MTYKSPGLSVGPPFGALEACPGLADLSIEEGPPFVASVPAVALIGSRRIGDMVSAYSEGSRSNEAQIAEASPLPSVPPLLFMR
jgi:hypothetical protein